jgi:type I restriction enzyme M protein
VPYSILVLNKERQRQEVLFVDVDDDSLEYSHDQISYLEGFEGSQKKNDASTDAFKAFANVVKIYRDFVGGKSVNDFAYKEVNQEMIEESDYNLHVNRYIRPYMYKAFRYSIEDSFGDYLGNIAELIRPQAVKSKKEQVKGQEFFEISGSDIPNAGWINQPKQTVMVKEDNLPKAEMQRIQGGDVLLAVKGAIGKVGIVPMNFEGDWLANQSYEILRLKEGSPIKDPCVLYMYLKSELAEMLLQYLSYGTSIATIQKRDLIKLRVIIPNDEQQEEIISYFEKEVRLKSRIEKLNNCIEKLNEDINQDHWNLENYKYGGYEKEEYED